MLLPFLPSSSSLPFETQDSDLSGFVFLCLRCYRIITQGETFLLTYTTDVPSYCSMCAIFFLSLTNQKSSQLGLDKDNFQQKPIKGKMLNSKGMKQTSWYTCSKWQVLSYMYTLLFAFIFHDQSGWCIFLIFLLYVKASLNLQLSCPDL